MVRRGDAENAAASPSSSARNRGGRFWAWLTWVDTDDPVRHALNRVLAVVLPFLLVVAAVTLSVSAVSGEARIRDIAILALPVFTLGFLLNRRGTGTGAAVVALFAALAIPVAVSIDDHALSGNPDVPLPYMFALLLATFFVTPWAGVLALAAELAATAVIFAVSDVPLEDVAESFAFGAIGLVITTGLLIAGALLLTRALREARTSQLAHERVIAAVPDYIWHLRVDRDGEVRDRYFSPVVERITGRPAAFYTDHEQGFLTTVAPEDRKRVAAAHERLLAGDRDYVEEEYRITRPDGEARWVHARAQAWRSPDGGLDVYGVASDITERKATEEALRESEERTREILDNTPAVVYIVDRDGRFLFVNRQWERTFGHSRDDVAGRRMHDVFPEDVAEAFQRFNAAVLRTRSALEEEEVAPQDGQLRTYRSLKFPLLDSAGEAYAVCGISTDVTDRKRSEEARERLEADLRQAQKMEAIGRLAGGVAHDFNNLLAVILGNSDMLVESLAADPAARELADEIRDAAQRGSGLTQQLLAFGRGQPFQLAVLDLNEVITEMHGLLRSLLGSDHELVTRLDPHAGLVEADRIQLEQVIANLVVNARDAMSGGGELVIETGHASVRDGLGGTGLPTEPGNYVILRVRDSGVGMDTETRRRIFEPFFTTKAVGQGTGLGLATVFGIVEEMGGSVVVESEPDVGSEFAVFLPRAKPRGEEAPERVRDPGAEGSETVLLVEDDASLRRLATSILRSHGYVVVEADDAEQALELWQENSTAIDVVLSDVVMPGASGIELAERVAGERPEVTIVLMSGYLGSAPAEIPGVEFLRKPFTPAGLLQSLRRAIEVAPR